MSRFVCIPSAAQGRNVAKRGRNAEVANRRNRARFGYVKSIAPGRFIQTDRTNMAIPNPSVQDAPGNRGARGPLGTEPNKPNKSGWVWLLVLVVLAGGTYYYYKTRPSAESKAAPAPGSRPASLGTVSVSVTSALKESVPYYLSGLGSVTAFNTV